MSDLTNILVVAAAAWFGMTVIMLGAWLYQRRVGNAGWTDVFWSYGTGIAGVAAALMPVSGGEFSRSLLVAGLVAVWSLRLGTYMAIRVSGSEEDQRYRELRVEWGGDFQRRLLRFTMLQPPVTALLAVSLGIAAHMPGPLGLRDLAGVMILITAIVGEAVADGQMHRYRANRERGPVMDRGLWGLSRHPNYFFEWLGWTAYPVIAFDPANLAGWLTLLAPGIMYLVLRYGSGVPMLEASMIERKGQAFRDYQSRVSVFFPLPRKAAQ